MYQLRPATATDYDFIYKVNEIDNKDYVIKLYGKWNEEFQKEFFKNKFQPEGIHIINVDGIDAGFMEIIYKENEIYIEELQLLPEYQNQGIGTDLITKIIRDTNKKNVTAGLRVLKINHAKNLYERLGFKVIAETDKHYIMRT